MSVPTNRLPPEGQRQLIELLGEFARNTMSTSQLATMTDMEHKVGPDPPREWRQTWGYFGRSWFTWNRLQTSIRARSKFSRK